MVEVISLTAACSPGISCYSAGYATFTLSDDQGNSTEFEVSVIADEDSDIVLDDVTYRAAGKDTLYVAGYKGSSSSLTIPETVEGMTVVRVGTEAFMNNRLSSIQLPDSISSIGDRAFKNCVNLTYIYGVSSVTSVGDETFYNCSSLHDISLGNVTSIGDRAFYYCTGISQFNVGDIGRITSISQLSEVDLGTDVFAGCDFFK